MENKNRYVVTKNDKLPKPYMVIVETGGDLTVESVHMTFKEAQMHIDKLNSTYTISDYSLRELQDFFSSIDFKPIENAINNYFDIDIRLKKTPLDYTIKTGYSFAYFSSENLCELIKGYEYIFADVSISSHLVQINCDKETGELYVTLPIYVVCKSYESDIVSYKIINACYKNGSWKIGYPKRYYELVEEYKEKERD